MSFGFSVSDILTTTQLAYKIYGVVQTGRKDAPASFGEVSDALFGLRCALEHLSQQVPKMSSAIPTKETNKIYQDLGVMIGGCSNTLEQFEGYLARYGAFVAPAPSTNVPTRPGQTGRGKRLLTATKVEWKKIQWAKDEKVLLNMRQRLLGHQNAINMVVQTIQCLWMQEIHGVSQSMSQAVNGLQQTWSNSEAPQLLKEIHEMMFSLQERPREVPPPYGGTFGPMMQTAFMHQTTEPTLTPVQPTPKKPDVQDEKIAAVNQRRTQIGKAALLRWQQSHPLGDQDLKVHIPGEPVPSVAAHIAIPMPPANLVAPTNIPSLDFHGGHSRPVQDFPNAAQWISRFEATITTCESQETPTAEEKRARLQTVVKEIQLLNRTLNAISSRGSRIRYRARLEESDGLSRAFDKAKAMLGGSLMLQKEIEVYEDDKEEDEP